MFKVIDINNANIVKMWTKSEKIMTTSLINFSPILLYAKVVMK